MANTVTFWYTYALAIIIILKHAYDYIRICTYVRTYEFHIYLVKCRTFNSRHPQIVATGY